MLHEAGLEEMVGVEAVEVGDGWEADLVEEAAGWFVCQARGQLLIGQCGGCLRVEDVE